MTEKEIKQLIIKNDSEKVGAIFNSVIEKSKSINREINLISIGMVILFLLYYLLELRIETGVNFGFIEISDGKGLTFVMPLVFSFLLLRFVILSSHGAELKKIIKIFSSEYFNYKNTKDEILYTDDLTRILLPFSIHDEIGKFDFKLKTGCISVLLILPLFLIALAPIYFVLFLTYKNVIQFNSIDIQNKVLVVLTIYILLITLNYFIKTLKLGLFEGKKDIE